MRVRVEFSYIYTENNGEKFGNQLKRVIFVLTLAAPGKADLS
jgi:hypothetical protein